MRDMKGDAKVVGDQVRVSFTVPLAAARADAPPPKELANADDGRDRASHAPGFECVNWYGTVYHFTPKQRLVVASLWQAMDDEAGSIDQDRLLADADSDQLRLRDLFDQGRHPAWNTMIVAALTRGGPRGCYMLAVPAEG